MLPKVAKSSISVRNQQIEYAKTSAHFHRDTLSRIEKVFTRAVKTIATSTRYLKDRNLFFAGASGVGKSASITKFVEVLAEHPLDLQDIVYGTDNVKTFLREEFPTCQDQPSFVLAMALRHALETAVKTRTVGDCFFLQEGVLSEEAVVLNLLKNTKQLEIRDLDAPFKTIALRAINREHHRGGRPVDFNTFASRAALCRKWRTTLINNLSEDQRYVMNYNGITYTAREMKTFNYHEPDDLSAIGAERITDEEVSQFDPALRDYVGLTILEAFDKVNERTVRGGV